MSSAPPAQSANGSLGKSRRPFRAFNPFSSSSNVSTTDVTIGTQSSDSSRPSTALRQETSRTHSRRESSISSLTELRSTIRRRSASLRSRGARSPTPENLAAPQSPEQRLGGGGGHSLRPSLTVSTIPLRQKSSDTLNDHEGRTLRPTTSAIEPRAPKNAFGHALKREESLKPLSAVPSARGYYDSEATALVTGPQQNLRAVFQHIQDMISKRISTLDYLRKAHEGRVYWFNALLFTKEDLLRLPSFEQRKLGRRATNYTLLGFSLPAVLDPNSENATDYLRAFSSLMSEFETYQSIHPADGSASSLSRTRIPQMFKRSGHSGIGGRSHRRGSDAISPQNTLDDGGLRSAGLSPSISGSVGGLDQELLPGEEYSFFLTPSLPFDPDYFETFATLCDTLIDCYTKITGLVNTPEAINPTIADLFAKVDSRIKKHVISGIVAEFGDASKLGIRTELAGIAKMALGGLM